jgi:LPXTG-motif cell wall-anchored protein
VVERGRNLFGSTAANSLSSAAIDDTSLSDLTVSSGTLAPSFNSATFSYSLTLPHSQSSIRLTPTRSGALSTITVNGDTTTSGSQSDAVTLSVGSNTIQVATANGSCTTTTTLTVTRQAAAPQTGVVPTTTTTLEPINPTESVISISAPRQVRKGTTITVVARGFIPGESVQMSVGTGNKTRTVTADANGEVRLTVRLTSSDGARVLAQAQAGTRKATQDIQVADSPSTLPSTGTTSQGGILLGFLLVILGLTAVVRKRPLTP